MFDGKMDEEKLAGGCRRRHTAASGKEAAEAIEAPREISITSAGKLRRMGKTDQIRRRIL